MCTDFKLYIVMMVWYGIQTHAILKKNMINPVSKSRKVMKNPKSTHKAKSSFQNPNKVKIKLKTDDRRK